MTLFGQCSGCGRTAILNNDHFCHNCAKVENVEEAIPCCVSLVEKAGITCDNDTCFHHDMYSDSGCEFIDYESEDT